MRTRRSPGCEVLVHRARSVLILPMAAGLLTQSLPAQRALTATPQLTIDGLEHDFSQVSRLSVTERGVVAVALQEWLLAAVRSAIPGIFTRST
jgi:hypothetical protein